LSIQGIEKESGCCGFWCDTGVGVVGWPNHDGKEHDEHTATFALKN
jgi:hypothetical protein